MNADQKLELVLCFKKTHVFLDICKKKKKIPFLIKKTTLFIRKIRTNKVFMDWQHGPLPAEASCLPTTLYLIQKLKSIGYLNLKAKCSKKKKS